MKRAKVLILAENDFHRRLMTDVVCCNEMRAVSSGQFDWIDKVASGAFQADVVVIDCGMNPAAVNEAVARLHSLPEARKPRVIGWTRGHDANDNLALEDRVAFPLDVGDFARVVKEQAQSHLLANAP